MTPNAFRDDAAAVLIFSIKLGGGVLDGDGAADDAALLVLLLLAISIVLDEYYILLNFIDFLLHYSILNINKHHHDGLDLRAYYLIQISSQLCALPAYVLIYLYLMVPYIRYAVCGNKIMMECDW